MQEGILQSHIIIIIIIIITAEVCVYKSHWYHRMLNYQFAIS